MPNCFNLTPKGVDEKPVSLQSVDDEMRKAFGAEPSATEWYRNWYNTIGFGLAMGNSFAKLKDIYKDSPQLLSVIDWIDCFYNVDTWAER